MKRLILLLLACGCTLAAHAQTVVQNTTYNSALVVSGPSTIDANTNVTVSSGADVTYAASTSVRLGPGFSAVSGSSFHAVIAPNGDVVPPTVPTGLAATGITSTVFTLSWNTSTDNVGVAGYEIRRDSTPIGTVTVATAAINNGIAPNTTYAMSVRAYDDAGNYSAWSNALSVTTSSGSGTDQTVAISPTSQTISVGQSITFTASGGHNGYVWGGSASGSGTTQSVTFNSSGTFSVTVYSPSGGGYNQSNSAASTITVNAAQPPVITSANTANGTMGVAFNYIITATNAPTSFNASGLPAGLSVNTSTGIISGTPGNGTAGTHTVTLSATNAYGTGTLTLTLTISGGTDDTTNQNQLNIHRPL